MNHFKQFTAAEWLYHLENLHQQEIQLGLTRIKQVAATLGLLKPKATVISVAGTNGKGSTVTALESIYLAAGYQVASYTSPHLLSFNERIKINQEAIRDEDLADSFCAIEEARNTIPLTYFEMATLAALWYFKKHAIDVLILEVGLGGRLDATNIIDADLAIITTIDLDHQSFLGHDKESIGYEKAGILRQNTPLIYADKVPPDSILMQASALNCPTYIKDIQYEYDIKDGEFRFFLEKEELLKIPKPKLHPNSIAAAIMASVSLKKTLPIQFESIVTGLSALSLEGRLQFVKTDHMVLFDVSHNPQAANYLADFIKKLCWPKKIHVVFSALKDKDIPGLISPLAEVAHGWYTGLLNGSRAASLEQFDAAFRICGIVPSYYDDPVSAYRAACKAADIDDLIVVYGSFMTVGLVLPTVYNSTRAGRYNEVSDG